MTLRIPLAIGVILAISLAFSSRAAEVTAALDENGDHIILFRGPVIAGDAAKVAELKNQLSDFRRTRRHLAAIHLDSFGGSYHEALRIADIVHGPDTLSALTTVVGPNANCHSACAIIFMAGQTGGASWVESSRRLHSTATLSFHAPYLRDVQGQFSGPNIEQTYASAISAIRELMKRKIVPASLLSELLAKGPSEAFVIDTIDKAGMYDIQIVGLSQRPLNAQTFCIACWNNHNWTRNTSAAEIPHQCDRQGNWAGTAKGFQTARRGNEQFVRVQFAFSRGRTTECKLRIQQETPQSRFIVGTFGPPGSDISDNDIDRFKVQPFHFYPASTNLRQLF